MENIVTVLKELCEASDALKLQRKAVSELTMKEKKLKEKLYEMGGAPTAKKGHSSHETKKPKPMTEEAPKRVLIHIDK